MVLYCIRPIFSYVTMSLQPCLKDNATSIYRWGYDLYPERRGDKYKPSWAKVAFLGEGRENIDKIKCERNVWKCAQKSKCNAVLVIKMTREMFI